MAFSLVIDGTDFSEYVARDGFSWQRYDIDAPNSGRDMRGKMHRKVVTKKYKLQVTCISLTDAQQSRLFAAISKQEVTVTFRAPDTNTTYTGQFYNSERGGKVNESGDDYTVNDAVSFNLIEV